MTALAIVVVDASGRPLSGVVCYLVSPLFSGGFLFAITNNDGYAVWAAPLPFTGTLQLAGAAKYYEVPLTGINGQNVTLRVGPSPANPQDVLLPPAVPFV